MYANITIYSRDDGVLGLRLLLDGSNDLCSWLCGFIKGYYVVLGLGNKYLYWNMSFFYIIV